MIIFEIFLLGVGLYIAYNIISFIVNDIGGKKRTEQAKKETLAKQKAIELKIAKRETLYAQSLNAAARSLYDSRSIDFPDIHIASLELTCNNGHHYIYGDFHYEAGTQSFTHFESHVETTTSHISGSTQDERHPRHGVRTTNEGIVQSERNVSTPITETFTTYNFGCPTCKSSLYTFDKPSLKEWCACSAAHDLFKRPLFYRRGSSVCPLCAAIQQLKEEIPPVNLMEFLLA